MSTQSAPSIRFTHSSPQQAFRLMELTPELLELITSKNAPTLYLKSGRTDHLSASSAGPENATSVNLCTPTQTFRIRQVQSSNSIHIIQPSNGHNNNKIIPLGNPAPQHEETAENGTEITLSPETVTAVAKCGSTLELQVIGDTESFALAKAMLARMLRVWDDHDGTTLYKQSGDREGDVVMADESGEITLLERRKSVKKSIIDDLPFSESKCLRAWTELCAFSPGGGYQGGGMEAIAFRPSASCKLNVWKQILECCTLQDIDLEKQFLVLDLWKAVSEDEVEGDMAMPKALFDAVIWRIVEQSGEVSVDSDDVNLRWANVDKEFCTKWIGETYLEKIAPTERAAIGKSEFINSWKDLLPETWRNHAILSNLPAGSYKTPDPVSIHFVSESDREKSKQEASGSAAGSKAKNSRDWHERFKSQRK